MLRRDEVDIGRLEFRESPEFRSDLHAHPIQRGREGIDAEQSREEKRVDARPLHKDKHKGGLLQELLASEIADGEGMNGADLRKLEPVALAAAIHAVQLGGGVLVATLGASRPQQLPVGKAGKEGRVLPVAVDIIDLVWLLDDD